MRLASTVVSSAQLSFGEVLLRLIVAGLFGSAIGLERELEGHDAGIRTHALLAVGSAPPGTRGRTGTDTGGLRGVDASGDV